MEYGVGDSGRQSRGLRGGRGLFRRLRRGIIADLYGGGIVIAARAQGIAGFFNQIASGADFTRKRYAAVAAAGFHEVELHAAALIPFHRLRHGLRKFHTALFGVGSDAGDNFAVGAVEIARVFEYVHGITHGVVHGLIFHAVFQRLREGLRVGADGVDGNHAAHTVDGKFHGGFVHIQRDIRAGQGGVIGHGTAQNHNR